MKWTSEQHLEQNQVNKYTNQTRQNPPSNKNKILVCKHWQTNTQPNNQTNKQTVSKNRYMYKKTKKRNNPNTQKNSKKRKQVSKCKIAELTFCQSQSFPLVLKTIQLVGQLVKLVDFISQSSMKRIPAYNFLFLFQLSLASKCNVVFIRSRWCDQSACVF